MAKIVIDTDDPRSVNGLLLAATADTWERCLSYPAAFWIPSQTQDGVAYLTDAERCGCQDFIRRQLPCKHVNAVRIYLVLSAAEHRTASPVPARAFV